MAELAVGGVVAERRRTFDHAVEDDRRLIAGMVTISRSGASIARRAIWMPWFWSSFTPLMPAIAALGAGSGRRRRPDDAFLTAARVHVQGVFDARLLFLHLNFGGSTTLITATPLALGTLAPNARADAA